MPPFWRQREISNVCKLPDLKKKGQMKKLLSTDTDPPAPNPPPTPNGKTYEKTYSQFNGQTW